MSSHEHDHDHGHSHNHAPQSLSALVGVLTLTSVVFLAELIAGIVSGSLALLADAAHMLSDSAGLVVALAAMLVGRRAASSRATFGYRRTEVLAAALNAGAVSAISVWIVVEAVQRIGRAEPIDTGVMLLVAVIGLIVNAVSALVLMRRQHDNLNMRGAYLHVLADMFGSVAVIIAGIVIRFTGFQAADTIASVIIAALILPRSVQLLMEALRVLLEAAEERYSGPLEAVHAALVAVSGVEEVHDLHVWSVDGTDLLASAHIVVSETPAELAECSLLDAATAALADHGIKHSTIQLESSAHAEHEEINH